MEAAGHANTTFYPGLVFIGGDGRSVLPTNPFGTFSHQLLRTITLHRAINVWSLAIECMAYPKVIFQAYLYRVQVKLLSNDVYCLLNGEILLRISRPSH